MNARVEPKLHTRTGQRDVPVSSIFAASNNTKREPHASTAPTGGPPGRSYNAISRTSEGRGTTDGVFTMLKSADNATTIKQGACSTAALPRSSLSVPTIKVYAWRLRALLRPRVETGNTTGFDSPVQLCECFPVQLQLAEHNVRAERPSACWATCSTCTRYRMTRREHRDVAGRTLHALQTQRDSRSRGTGSDMWLHQCLWPGALVCGPQRPWRQPSRGHWASCKLDRG